MAQQSLGGIRLVEVRVRNFRCLAHVEVALDPVTLLVGENNAGKTSFLDALYFAIGAGPRGITEDDVFLAPGEAGVPRERRVTIDILIRPTDGKGNIIAQFPASSAWLSLWGEGVTQDDQDHDIVGLRTQARWDAAKSEYAVNRAFLRDWPPALDDAHCTSPTSTLRAVASIQLEPLALYLLDAKRDIASDLRNPHSFWSKLVSHPDLSPDDVKKIEATLNEVNDRIVAGSSVLSHLQTHLAVLSDSLPGITESVTITPVSRHLRDLTKGMDVLLSSTDAATFPLSRQGMGTRSVATILTFRAYAEWKQAHAKGSAVHPLLAVEEPEAHLHPHAQRALFEQFKALPGQCIITTHSPYICSQTSILHFRHFRRHNGLTTVRHLTAGTLNDDDLRKVHRAVINTRGDMLFAKAVILVSGETEEQALPAFADAFLPRTSHELGLSVISVGGDGSYLPFLRLAECFGIPWFIFSDGEPKAISDVNAALAAVGQPLIGANCRVFAIPGDRDFETYLADECYQPLAGMVIDMKAKNPQHREALTKEWASKTRDNLIKELQSAKTRYGRPIADTITSLPDHNCPSLVRDILTAVAHDLHLSQ
jgi:putative ATP-dependent endonuclease of OLD family